MDKREDRSTKKQNKNSVRYGLDSVRSGLDSVRSGLGSVLKDPEGVQKDPDSALNDQDSVDWTGDRIGYDQSENDLFGGARNDGILDGSDRIDSDKDRFEEGYDFDFIEQSGDVVEKKLPPILRKVPIMVIILSCLALGVIIFAFVMEARTSREVNEPVQQLSESEIQTEIDGLDWVEQVFIPVNEYSRPGTKLEDVNAIVIHYIGNPGTTAMQNRNYFANLEVTQETRASSNFIVCLDGTILQCIPVYEIAYASNERNADTLSIEICHYDETGRFTRDTYDAAVRLTAWLLDRFGLTSSDIIRHYDVSGKECPIYFVENEDAWEMFKTDVAKKMGQS